MRVRRHLPPLHVWHWPRPVAGVSARRFGLYLAAAALAGYLTAFLIFFPAPLFGGHDVVPRVVGLPLGDATRSLQKAGLVVQDGGSEPDPSASAGTVIWQDPLGGVARVPRGLPVTLVSSGGPPKIPVPDVTGLDVSLAGRLVGAAGLAVTPAESVEAAFPPGITMLTRPAAGTLLAPGAAVTVVVSRGAPTIPVPDVVGMSQTDARTRIKLEGLALGTVTRRRTPAANPGTVVAQEPGAGTLAAPGTVVDLVVARSP